MIMGTASRSRTFVEPRNGGITCDNAKSTEIRNCPRHNDNDLTTAFVYCPGKKIVLTLAAVKLRYKQNKNKLQYFLRALNFFPIGRKQFHFYVLSCTNFLQPMPHGTVTVTGLLGAAAQPIVGVARNGAPEEEAV